MSEPGKAVEQTLGVLLEEYKALRAELLQTMGHTRQVAQFSGLIAAALLASVSTIFSNPKFAFLFLIAPLLFWQLNLTFLRYMYLHSEIIDHLRRHVNPLIRAKLAMLDREEKKSAKETEKVSQLMTWEDKAGGPGPLRRYRFWHWPIFTATAGFIQLEGFLSLLGYGAVVYQKNISISRFDEILIALNVVGLTYTLVFGLKVGHRK